MPQFVFNSRDPIVMGVIVEAGIVKEGTPICVPSKGVSADLILRSTLVTISLRIAMCQPLVPENSHVEKSTAVTKTKSETEKKKLARDKHKKDENCLVKRTKQKQ